LNNCPFTDHDSTAAIAGEDALLKYLHSEKDVTVIAAAAPTITTTTTNYYNSITTTTVTNTNNTTL